MTTLQKLKNELEPYKNTLVIYWFDVVRLVDVIDGNDDYYWVFSTAKGITPCYMCGGMDTVKR
jgi:hypothetical protein